MADAAPAGQKLDWLDALRGWAILLVILTHTRQGEFALRALDQFAPHAPLLSLPPMLARIAGDARFGVNLFFVVSAFSLARSTMARAAGGETVGLAFLVRRVARIGPAFWLAALGYTAWFGMGPRLFAPSGITGFDVGLTVLMLHVWWPNALNSVVPGGWSIGCEMSFYLLLPAVLGVANRAGRMMALLPVGLALVELGWWALDGPALSPIGFIVQLPSFYLGIVAWRATQTSGFARLLHLPRRLVAATAVLVFAAMVVALPQTALGLGQSPVAFAVLAALLCVLLHAAPARLLVNRVAVALGRVSYSMYLVHFLLLSQCFAAVSWLVGPPRSVGLEGDSGFLALYFALVVVAAFLAATVSFRLVEQPGMALGGWLIRRYRLAAAPRCCAARA